MKFYKRIHDVFANNRIVFIVATSDGVQSNITMVDGVFRKAYFDSFVGEFIPVLDNNTIVGFIG